MTKELTFKSMEEFEKMLKGLSWEDLNALELTVLAELERRDTYAG